MLPRLRMPLTGSSCSNNTCVAHQIAQPLASPTKESIQNASAKPSQPAEQPAQCCLFGACGQMVGPVCWYTFVIPAAVAIMLVAALELSSAWTGKIRKKGKKGGSG